MNVPVRNHLGGRRHEWAVIGQWFVEIIPSRGEIIPRGEVAVDENPAVIFREGNHITVGSAGRCYVYNVRSRRFRPVNCLIPS